MAKRKLDHLVNIEEDQFPSNSKASQKVAPIRDVVEEDVTVLKTPEGRLENNPVRHKAIRRRKSITRSIRESFINEDSKNVGQYIIFEVLVPAAKTLIQDMITQGIEMFLYGESSGRKGRNRDTTVISYGNMYKRRDRDDDRRPRSSRRDRFNLGDIFFRRGDEAADVLGSMCDLLEKYDQVTVGDYFDLAQVDGATWVHAKWGWESLKDAKITHTRDGYFIILPEPIELD